MNHLEKIFTHNLKTCHAFSMEEKVGCECVCLQAYKYYGLCLEKHTHTNFKNDSIYIDMCINN